MGRGAAAVIADLAAQAGSTGCCRPAAPAARRSRPRSSRRCRSASPSCWCPPWPPVTCHRTWGPGTSASCTPWWTSRASTGSPGWCSATPRPPWPAWSPPAERAARDARGPDADDRPLIAASMFGVTTPAVETARARLTELGYEVLVFHATGAGGRAMEALAEARLVSGVLDLTTTELADDLVGGVLSAGPAGCTAAGRRRAAAGDRARRARHGQLRAARHGAGGVQRPAVLRAQPDRDAHADHAGGDGRARRQDRPQGRGRQGPGRPCSGRTAGSARSTPTASRSATRTPTRPAAQALDGELSAAGLSLAPGRRAPQRPGVRHRDGATGCTG